MRDAGLVSGRLRVEVEIDQVDKDLHVPLRLKITAHHAEAEPRLIILRHHRRDDGMEGALVRLEPVEGIGIERETVAPILDHETGLSGDEKRPEGPRVALNERAAIAVLVDDAQINRVA